MVNSSSLYALPNATDSSSMYGFISYVNTTSDGLFMPVFYGVLYLIIFISSVYVTRPSVALTFTSFICSILAMMLAVLGFLSPTYMYLTFLALAAGVFWMRTENR